jgi:hypothetical protein
MKTILEMFYVRVLGKSVWYQRKEANLSRSGGGPDRFIRSLLREKRRPVSGESEQKDFIVHSTSWRYEQPDKIILTYVAYSDELVFKGGKAKHLPLTRLHLITKKSLRPSSAVELENRGVSHAMRHIAFLICFGDQDNFKSVLKPKTVEVFENLWISLAGKVF